MDKNYAAPAGALKKLKKARSIPQTVYLYGATGYGKTELVRQYLSGRRYIYLSCEELPWEAGALPPKESGRQNRRVVVIDDLHRLKSEELRRQIIALEQREDIWLILISRSPIPAWLMSQHIKDVFLVISENDLRLNAEEIGSYLDACGVAYTEDAVQYLQGTAEGNAYVVRHVALKLKEGKSLGPELYEEIHEAFSVYLENNVLVRWDSDLLEFLMQVSVVDGFTLELAEMISGNPHVAASLEQAAEAGNFLTHENGVYRLRPTLIRALRNRAAKVYGRERVKDLKYNAALYYEMHDEVVPALKLFKECGKNERIKNLLIRNARMNPGNGHYYELRRYYFSMDEREIGDSPVLMAGMSMLYSMLMDGEKSEYWYEKLKAFAANAKGGVRREAQSRLAYLDIGLPHRGSRNVLEIMKNVPALLFDKGNHLPEFSVTSNLPSTMNGGKDFCHWSPEDTKIAKRYGALLERVFGRYGKGLVKAALGESYYEKGGDNYQVMSLLAQALLEKLRYYAEQTNRPYVRMEVGLLSAVTKERMGGPWQEELSAALQEAEQYRFLRLISEEGTAAWPLLQQEKKSLLDAGTLDGDWLHRLLNETEDMAQRYPLYLKKRAAAAADFSGTAMTILRLQADGLSLNRIAGKLAMKPDSVKYHIRENYRKLNASGKADALLAARSLGLL